MIRSLAPKVRGEGQPVETELPKEKRRKCVPSACVACRKRKSKCDGKTPACSSCVAVYHTHCYYDGDTLSTKKRPFEQGAASATADTQAIGSITSMLRTLPDSEASELVRKIQGCQDLDALAKSVDHLGFKDATASSPSRHHSSSHESAAPEHPGGSTFYGSTSTLRFRDLDEDARGQTASLRADSIHESKPWTSITSDHDFIEHLLRLYFVWCHPIHPLFSEQLFYEGYRRADPRYCSSILVNAILAFACHYSDRPEARTDPLCPRTAGDDFFAEAKALMNEDERPFLTTIQANAIMSYREASMGRDTTGYHRIHMSIAMALETGLNLNLSYSPQTRAVPVDVEERKVTFWGCFAMDTVWALCTGRIPTVQNAAITLDRCSLAARPDLRPWAPYSDESNASTVFYQSINAHNYLYYFSTLIEITNDMLFMFFANKQTIPQRWIMNFNARIEGWYASLPDILRVHADLSNQANDGPILPNVLLLHAMYHTCILQLFSLSVEAPSSVEPRCSDSKERPDEICRKSASRITDLGKAYRRDWTVRRTSIALVHSLLWACFTHIADLPSPGAARYLVESMYDLRHMAENHPIAGEGIMIIWLRAGKLHKKLPDSALRIIHEVKDQDYLRNGDWCTGVDYNVEVSQGPGISQSTSERPTMHHNSLHTSMLPSGIQIPAASLGAQGLSTMSTHDAQSTTPSTVSYPAHTAPFDLTPTQGMSLQQLYWTSFSHEPLHIYRTMEPEQIGAAPIFESNKHERLEHLRGDHFPIGQGYNASVPLVDNMAAVQLARADFVKEKGGMSSVKSHDMNALHRQTSAASAATLSRLRGTQEQPLESSNNKPGDGLDWMGYNSMHIGGQKSHRQEYFRLGTSHSGQGIGHHYLPSPTLGDRIHRLEGRIPSRYIRFPEHSWPPNRDIG